MYCKHNKLQVVNITTAIIKKVLGKMKDEYGGKSIVKFVGLKSKMYLY